jgi:hypothetical protein
LLTLVRFIAQTESPERFIAYIGELNSNFELLEIITAAQKTVEDESGSVQALEARMKKGISNMQQVRAEPTLHRGVLFASAPLTPKSGG